MLRLEHQADDLIAWINIPHQHDPPERYQIWWTILPPEERSAAYVLVESWCVSVLTVVC